MASLSTCHLGLWLGWQILLNLVKQGCSVLRTVSPLSSFKNDINEIIKCNDNYARGLSLMHLNIRSIAKNIDKLSNYLTLLDLQFSIIALIA